jgi:hypothetical protein
MTWQTPFAFGRAYMDLHQNNTCGDLEDTEFAIDPYLYKGGATILCFSLLPDQANCAPHLSEAESGILSLKLTVKNELPKPAVIFILSEFNREMCVDQERKVTIN